MKHKLLLILTVLLTLTFNINQTDGQEEILANPAAKVKLRFDSWEYVINSSRLREKSTLFTAIIKVDLPVHNHFNKNFTSDDAKLKFV